jgi:hypothetical protein
VCLIEKKNLQGFKKDEGIQKKDEENS